MYCSCWSVIYILNGKYNVFKIAMINFVIAAGRLRKIIWPSGEMVQINFAACQLHYQIIDIFHMDQFIHVIRIGDLEAVRRMQAADPEIIHRRDSRGFPPLTMASYSDQLEIVQFLIAQGADVNARDAAGNTALMGAVFKGHAEQVRLLLEAGTDVDAVNSQGGTALSFAVAFEKVDIARMLVAAGADPDKTDGQGMSPRNLARQKGNETMVAALS
jgi:ankyrin repeat protein